MESRTNLNERYKGEVTEDTEKKIRKRGREKVYKKN